MTIEQWLFQYKLIKKQKSEEAKVKIETIKAVVGESVEIMKALFERNAEMSGFFSNRELYFEYMDKKKEIEKRESSSEDGNKMTDDESMQHDFDLFMSDAFPDDVVLETKIPLPDAAVIKKKKKRLVGIQARK